MQDNEDLPLSPGGVVGGRYRVEDLLGVGGMGAVFGGRDLMAGGAVAIKCLLLGLGGENSEPSLRFLREMRAMARLKSEHTVRVLGSGRLRSGEPFVVMERLRGDDLRVVQKRRGRVTIAEASEWVSQACEALTEAHSLGIVHRDLKLSNLFLTVRSDGSDCVKLLDFGIAKFTSPNVAGDDLEVTRCDAPLGARAYMSPEQVADPSKVDPRSDIWSLGVVLYYLTSGEVPFPGNNAERVARAILQDEPKPLETTRPGVSPGFAAIVRRCLSKNRDDRYPNAMALARALMAYTGRNDMTNTLPLGALMAPAVADLIDLEPSPEAVRRAGLSDAPTLASAGPSPTSPALAATVPAVVISPIYELESAPSTENLPRGLGATAILPPASAILSPASPIATGIAASHTPRAAIVSDPPPPVERSIGPEKLATPKRKWGVAVAAGAVMGAALGAAAFFATGAVPLNGGAPRPTAAATTLESSVAVTAVAPTPPAPSATPTVSATPTTSASAMVVPQTSAAPTGAPPQPRPMKTYYPYE